MSSNILYGHVTLVVTGSFSTGFVHFRWPVAHFKILHTGVPIEICHVSSVWLAISLNEHDALSYLCLNENSDCSLPSKMFHVHVLYCTMCHKLFSRWPSGFRCQDC